MKKNYFITFEGIDGSGKDTQLSRLIPLIKEDNNNVFGDKYSNIWVTRNPSKMTLAGKRISDYIRGDHVEPMIASELFTKDRKEHTTKYISPILLHSHVLCSRYDLSTLAFQLTQGVPFDKLYEMHEFQKPKGSIIPDLTVVFDLPVKESLKRLSKRNSQKEFFEKENFQREVAKKHHYCIEKLREYDGRNIIVVNSYHPEAKSISEEMQMTTNEMIKKIGEYLK